LEKVKKLLQFFYSWICQSFFFLKHF